jgi:hypothetical protein
MTNLQAESREELENVAAAAIGQVVLVLSRLEFNISLYLRNAVGGADPDGANPLVSRLTFKSKLDALRDVVAHKFAAQPAASLELGQWLKGMDTFRPKRNSFIHGRWGFALLSQEIINVSPGLPNGRPQKEVRYSAEDLESARQEIEHLAAGFSDWRKKWPF